MKVLSLFDGISCARVALGDRVTTYSASEIDTNAIAISQKNYPDIVRLGDVREVRGLTDIDLLIGGSPCQDLSIAKKDRKGLEGDRSGLFWEYARVLREVKPKWFILENVASMPKADRDIITQELGVEPLLIDAALVSAQSRKRLFWTNIPGVTQPADRGILLKDILETEVSSEFDIKGQTFTATGAAVRGNTRTVTAEGVTYSDKLDVREDGKANALTPTFTNKLALVKVGFVGEGEQYGQGGQAHRVYSPDGKTPTLSSFGPLVKVGHVGTSDSQANRVYSPEGKTPTLSANGGGLGAKTGLYAVGRDIGRRLNEEGKRDDANEDLPYQRRIEVREDGKSGTLTSVMKDNLVVGAERIRKLTPVECERLQGLPDGYTAGVAKTHRYKCLGNAFHVEVIKHILSFLR